MTLTENLLDESRYLINLDHFKLFIKSPKYVIKIWFMINEGSIICRTQRSLLFFQRPLLFISHPKIPLFMEIPPPILKIVDPHNNLDKIKLGKRDIPKISSNDVFFNLM